MKPLVIIPQTVVDKIQQLHKTAPLNTEWSGVLIFTDNSNLSIKNSVKNNSVNIPTEIYVEDIVPMNIGSSAYTSFNMASPQMNEYIFKNFDRNFKTGLIHTHHSMKAYFSSTDLEELDDNSKSYEYYLSLIVNYRLDMVAKIGLNKKENIKKTYETYTIKNGKILKFVDTKDVVKNSSFNIDCNIVIESSELDEIFKTGLKEIVKVKEDKIKKPVENIKSLNVKNVYNLMDFDKDYKEDDKDINLFNQDFHIIQQYLLLKEDTIIDNDLRELLLDYFEI